MIAEAKLTRQDALATAIRLLSRREYSDKELRLRLRNRNFVSTDIESVISELIDCGYLSNQRFAECYARSRSGQGYGPVRIEMELSDRGISDAQIQRAMSLLELDWQEQARDVLIRKFGSEWPADVKQRSKQWRFMQYRGFASEQIKFAFKRLEAHSTTESA